MLWRHGWIPSERYVGIDIDKDGKIWFATKPLGILIYDPETNRVNKLFSDLKVQKEMAERNLHLYIDGEGIIWTSYYVPKGIYQLLPYSPYVKSYSSGSKNNSLSHSTITTIAPGVHGKMWIGTLDGLNILAMRYDQNNITIDAGIIDYYTRGEGRLRFKLDGEDIQRNWSYIEPDQTYTPGKFTTRIL